MLNNRRVYGYELEFMLNRSDNGINTSLSGGYTFIYPVEFNKETNKNTNTFLKYRRKHSIKINLTTGFKKWESGVNLFYRSKLLNIDEVFLNPTTRESILPGFYDYWLADNKGYILLDANLGYKLTKILTVSIAVKNLTNTEYMGRPGDIQPQRNFSIRLSGPYKFFPEFSPLFIGNYPDLNLSYTERHREGTESHREIEISYTAIFQIDPFNIFLLISSVKLCAA